MAIDHLKAAADLMSRWDALDAELRAQVPVPADAALMASAAERAALQAALEHNALPDFVDAHQLDLRQ